VPNGQITAAADGGTNREDESESGGFHASIRCPTIKMTDEEERATAARLEHAPARAPPHSVHRLVRAVHLLAL
jgi:hypothetical protein